MIVIAIILFLGSFVHQWTNATPSELLEIKYPMSREEAFHKLREKSDFIFDFYNPRPIDIIDGADAGRTVRAKQFSHVDQQWSFDVIISHSTMWRCEFELGFIEDNAANFTGHIIKEGQGTLFPQGSIHYFINTQCENSSLVAVASSEDPGRIDVATSFFKALPPSMISAALGGQKVKIDENKLPTVDPAQGTEECRRRCNLL
ncbi:unnamed protein product [Rotaria magnacalcarata]|uniref:Cupin type-1 domain-containing protein n=1 Tax=Rotaria magnacalcarata TaxID=392030 RepID=A0A819L4Y7_9BILA|nr:unnamed protein product [Rotaria magnacalcarata]